MASIKETKLYNQSGQLISPVTIVDSIKMSDGTKLIDYLNSRGTVSLSGTTVSNGSTNVQEINLYRNGEWVTPYIVADSIKMRNGKKLIDAINEVLIPKSWTEVSDSKFGTSNIKSICYGNGKFVAGGQGGKIAYSTDGINWTAVSNSKFEGYNIMSICYGNGKYVAGGAVGKMSYSTDGITWTAVSDPKFGRTTINSICYGNGKFVAVTNSDGKRVYSTDGIT